MASKCGESLYEEVIVVKQNISYKFRLYPNKEQEIMFNKTFGCVRFIYNKMLSDKIEYYKESKKKLNNTPAQYKKEFEWLKEVDSLALANAQIQLQTAYNNFFRRKDIGFPKFRSKKKGENRYTTNNQRGSICIISNKIKLPKVGYVKAKVHRQIPDYYIIKSATIFCNAARKYYISILVERDCEPPIRVLDKDKSLGLDYSSPSFYVDSQGNEANYPKFYRNAEYRLAKEQRKLSKMKFGSNNYKKQKIIIAKLHEHISNQRKDFLHKLSRELVNNWDIICVEDINLKGMAGSLHLGKSTNDNGFGMFRVFLKYKLAEQGKMFIKIDKWFPSSKTCHCCGTINQNLTLKDREWDCDCGAHLLRDVNAAINIREIGLGMI